MAVVAGAPMGGVGDPQEYLVPAGPGSQLSCAWSSGMHMHTCGVASSVMGQGGVAPALGTAPWLPLDTIRRRLAFAVAPLYTGLRRQLNRLGRNQQSQQRQALQRYSQAVMQLMQECSEEGGAGCTPTSYEAALWHLLHLFFLEDDMGLGYFPEAFAGWLRQHGAVLSEGTDGAHPLQVAVQYLAGLPRPEADPHYWPTVLRLVMVGQLDEAVEVLLLHPAYKARGAGASSTAQTQVDVLEELVQLLKLVPLLSGDSESRLGAGQPLADAAAFQVERAAWLAGVEGRLAGGRQVLGELRAAQEGAMADGVERLLTLLAAGSSSSTTSAAAMGVMAGVADNWVELLTGLLLWKYPDLQPRLHLRHLVLKVVREQPTTNSNTALLELLAQLLPAAAGAEVQQVVTSCCNTPFCSLWFVTHMYDLLRGYPAAEALFSKPLPSRGCDQCEMFTLNFAQSLAGARSTWQLSAEYFAWCPLYGREAMEQLLDTCPFFTACPSSARKALGLARHQGLQGAATRLTQRLAAAAAAEGRPLEGLQWLLEGGDTGGAGQLLAPLVVQVVEVLEAQVRFAPTTLEPLDLPWLLDLAPLLATTASTTRHTSSSSSTLAPATNGAVGGSGGGGGSSSTAAAVAELQLLAALLELQEAAAALQQHLAAAAEDMDTGGDPAAEQQLTAAAEALRGPAMALLAPGGSPPLLQLLLLTWLQPLLTQTSCPFTRHDLQQLQRLLVGLSAPGAAVVEAVAGQQQQQQQEEGVQLTGLAAWSSSSSSSSDGGWHQQALQSVRVQLVRAAACKRLAAASC